MKKSVCFACLFVLLIYSVQAGSSPRPLDDMWFLNGVIYSDTIDIDYLPGGENTQIGHSLCQRWPQDDSPFPLLDSQSYYYYGLYEHAMPVTDTYAP